MNTEYVCIAVPLIELDTSLIHTEYLPNERVVRCRDCGFARRDGDDICCARSLRLDERGVSRLSLVRLDGFCAWGVPREVSE